MCVNWIRLAQDKFLCRALVNTVLSLGSPQKAGHFLTASRLLAFDERGLHCMELVNYCRMVSPCIDNFSAYDTTSIEEICDVDRYIYYGHI